VSQKNIPDIFDCSLTKDYLIFIIVDISIPDTTVQSNHRSTSHITQRLILHYLGKTKLSKYYIFFIQGSIIT